MADIRPMKPEDWEELRMMDVEIFPDDPLEEESFRKWIGRDGCFVLLHNGQIAGNLIVARFGQDEGHLGRIGVAKAHQKRGFGSVLMEYAVNWFKKQGGIRQVHLYTQDFNVSAQTLYKKYGFEKTGTTWHFFIPYDSVSPKHEYSCQIIQDDEIELVGEKFPELPAEQIRRYLSDEEYIVLTLKDRSGYILGACRFTPSFPGCFPFKITHTGCFDDFINGMREFSLPKYDYVRATFTDLPELAILCESRDYKLHHRLFKMTLKLDRI